jgi:hypothetical protein
MRDSLCYRTEGCCPLFFSTRVGPHIGGTTQHTLPNSITPLKFHSKSTNKEHHNLEINGGEREREREREREIERQRGERKRADTRER